MTAECQWRLSTGRGSWRGPFASAGSTAVCFHYTVGIWMSSAVRNMLGRERASSLCTWGRWEQLPGELSRGRGRMGVAPAARHQPSPWSPWEGEKKVGLTCKQSRLERKLIGGNFIWSAEALFLKRLCFVLTTLQQLELRACVETCFAEGSLPVLPELLFMSWSKTMQPFPTLCRGWVSMETLKAESLPQAPAPASVCL